LPDKPCLAGGYAADQIYLGERVCANRNNYDTGARNGEIGVIIRKSVTDIGDRQREVFQIQFANSRKLPYYPTPQPVTKKRAEARLNCNRAKSCHFSMVCTVSPYSRSRETFIALAGTNRESAESRIRYTIKNVFLDRTPVGGFSGHIHLAAIGAQPPVVEPEPQRPTTRKVPKVEAVTPLRSTTVHKGSQNVSWVSRPHRGPDEARRRKK
jgi:hypothetical protein